MFYESSQINYKLIFHFDSHYLPHSKFLFLAASILTLIYLFLLFMFMLVLSGTIQTNFLDFGELFWALITCYIFLPLPILNYKGRLYFIKILLRVIASPFIQMNFLIIWVSEQLVSLNQPFADFFYTICSYATKDYARCTKTVPNVSSVYIITMFSYRILQNLKFWRQISPKGEGNFWAPPFLGFVRAFFGLNTAIAALLFRLDIFPTAKQYWIAIAIISTLVSWFVDMKGDWGLLGFEHKLLREKLLFPKAKPAYYFIGFFNLALRTAWVFSISPFVTKSTGFLPLIFIMIVSLIEIFRRGIWNILRL